MIAVPHIWLLRAELTEFLLKLTNEKHEIKIFLSWWRPITNNRNIIRKVFLESWFDKLLTIDSDVVPPDNILDMVTEDLDICAGDISTARGKEIIKLALDKVEWWYRTKEKLILWLNEVDATWTWCTIFSRKVLEDVWEFETDNEDFNYCERAKDKWYKIYFDTRFKCLHYQTYPI